MTLQRGQTVFYTTKLDSNERSGIVQEVTDMGYLINNTWYSKGEISLKNILLDSRTEVNNKQLILG